MKNIIRFLMIIAAAIVIGIPAMAQETQKGSIKGSRGDHVDSADPSEHPLNPVRDKAGEIRYYTCGMHPSVKVSVENYKKGDTKCPICFMPLTPVKAESVSTQSEEFDEHVMSRVKVRLEEARRAGVETVPVVKRKLYKNIRTVGTVAYDPQLAVAQDEFISAVRTLKKIEEGHIPEIIERSRMLVDSAQRKLRLLGLGDDQISQMRETLQAGASLILPEKQMWVYADVYEFEVSWVNPGDEVKVTTVAYPGELFEGKIVSVNSVFDRRTRSLRVRASVDNSELKLKPDMYVDVEILSPFQEDGNGEGVLSIPQQAMLDTGKRKIVWVDKGHGEFEGRHVRVGPVALAEGEGMREFLSVVEGLSEGERVVTKANFLIDSQSQITGIAATAYGGALEADAAAAPMPAGHSH